VIPLYRILQSLHLIGTLGALILPYSVFGLPLAVLILMAFFGEIPIDFEEAAFIDGMSRLGAFVRIILPMATPGLFTTAIIVFVGNWNEYLFALNFTTSGTYTLPVGIVTISQTEFTTNFGILSAATILSVVPLVVLILLLERRIVSGLMAGGLKG
jgi:multiple sugar transport system permease protein